MNFKPLLHKLLKLNTNLCTGAKIELTATIYTLESTSIKRIVLGNLQTQKKHGTVKKVSRFCTAGTSILP